jgi:hypothetical protein
LGTFAGSFRFAQVISLTALNLEEFKRNFLELKLKSTKKEQAKNGQKSKLSCHTNCVSRWMTDVG